MKSIITALKTQHDCLLKLVQRREDTFSERTERWQESEKGEDYQDKTQDIENQADELDLLIDNLEELN